MSETSQSTLKDIDTILEFQELNDFMQDEDLAKALNTVIKLSVKSESVPPAQIPALIVKLQSLSAIFAMKATSYATILKEPTGKPNNHKKNIYYSANSALDRVVDSLKYMSKYGIGN